MSFNVGDIIVDKYNYICKVHEHRTNAETLGLSFKNDGLYSGAIERTGARKARPDEIQAFYNNRTGSHIESIFNRYFEGV